MNRDPYQRPDWHRHALCRGGDPDIVALFFPERGDDTTPAKALCLACPVQGRCLEAGIREKHGIWGGVQRTRPPPHPP